MALTHIKPKQKITRNTESTEHVGTFVQALVKEQGTKLSSRRNSFLPGGDSDAGQVFK